jgi:hypothetical protein
MSCHFSAQLKSSIAACWLSLLAEPFSSYAQVKTRDSVASKAGKSLVNLRFGVFQIPRFHDYPLVS